MGREPEDAHLGEGGRPISATLSWSAVRARAWFFCWPALAWGGCSGADRAHVPPSWPAEVPAVVAVIDVNGRAVGSSPWMYREGLTLELPAEELPARIFAQTFSPLSAGGPDLERCPPVHAGSGPRAVPKLSFTSNRIEQVGDDVSFGAESEPFTDLGLTLGPPCALPLCERTTKDAFSYGRAGSEVDLKQIVALPSGRALVFPGDVEDGSHGVLRFDRTLGFEEVLGLPLEGGVSDVARALDGTIYVALDRGRILQLDAEASLLVDAPLPFVARGLSAGRDGTVIAYSSTQAVELSRGSTLTRALEGGLPGNVTQLVVVTRDRIFATHGRGLDRFDGTAWRRELDHAFEFDPEAPHRTLLAADDDIAWVLDANASWIRDERAGTWASSTPPSNLSMHVLRTLGQGRLMAGGQEGTVVLYEHEKWCLFPTYLRNRILAADTTPDGRSLMLVTWSSDGYAWLLILDLPAD